jgi:hypothetical protein
MKKIVFLAAMALLVVNAHAQDANAPTATPSAPTAASEPKAESAPVPTAAPPQASVSQETPAPVAPEAAKPRKQRVVKHETNEHKARRIAAKYGVYW